ncbi:MAG: M24 family metallopeptidase [Planctomycetota bacterium]|jgi:Xaa-Pro aminopeptidase
MGRTGRLHFADSSTDADLYYLTRFLAGDPFLFLEVDGRRTLFLSDLEVDRGRRQSEVDEVVRLARITEAVKKRYPEMPPDPWLRIGAHVEVIARERDLAGFEVPATFPVGLADVVRGHGLGVRWVGPPFVPERVQKTPEEVESIRRAIAHTEAAMSAAIDRIRAAEIRDGLLHDQGEPLTAEAVRFTINTLLLERDCHAYQAIVAGGDQGVDPHERGHGALPADLPIILDIFPRDNATRYHGDMTRTIVRGRASEEAKRMFQAVREAKGKAEAMLRDGVDGHDVHEAVKQSFKDAGFETGEKDGRMEGFFHGTGHGLGLQVHEYPRIGSVHEILRAGSVVTVEPGLYYPGVGGVRLEDDVLITADGCENLCTLDHEFEI